MSESADTSHGTAEEPNNALIQQYARDGLTKTGHHGKVDSMGVPRDQLPKWDDLQLITAQQTAAMLEETNAAIQTLASEARSLNSEVGAFRITGAQRADRNAAQGANARESWFTSRFGRESWAGPRYLGARSNAMSMGSPIKDIVASVAREGGAGGPRCATQQIAAVRF